jgi:hypothetical protein
MSLVRILIEVLGQGRLSFNRIQKHKNSIDIRIPEPKMRSSSLESVPYEQTQSLSNGMLSINK